MIAFLPGAISFAVAVLALSSAGLRIAGALDARGAERLLVAAPVAAAVAVISSLALGLAGLGGSSLALLGSALAVWLAALRLPGTLSWRPRVGWGAAAALGGGLAWVAWVARYPSLGVDPLTYHLSESVLWLQSGHVGTVRDILDDFPVGNYPVTGEVLVTWAMGLAGSFAPALLLTPAAALLFAVTAFTALRRLGASTAAAALAPAAVLLVPIAAAQHIGPHTDLPALAWLAVAAALVAADRPSLLPAALLAGALAVGTKTTAAPLGALVLAYGLFRHRRALPWRALALATAAGVIAGGTWYVRNWIDHGWPLWPFAPGPFGDPAPPLLALIDHSFLERPAFTLRGRVDDYFDVSGAAVLVLASGALAWVLARRRLVIALSAASAVATLIWLNAPFTGRADLAVVDFSLTTVRYLLPALAAGAAALALARRRSATAILAVATAVSAWKTFDLPFPFVPGELTVLAGALLGAAATPLARRVPAAGWVAALAVFVALAAPGLPGRHARTSGIPSAGVLRFFLAQDGREPVAFTFQILSVAAGDGLERELSFIPRSEPCERVRARLQTHWILGARLPGGTPDPLACLSSERPAYRDAAWVAYRPR